MSLNLIGNRCLDEMQHVFAVQRQALPETPTLVRFEWLMGSRLLDWRICGWFTCNVVCAVLLNHFAAFLHLWCLQPALPLFLSPIPVLLCSLESWLSFCRLAAKEGCGWRRCALKFFTASDIGCSLAAWLSSWFLPSPL